ncbi:hypothetical protein P170DRAFT_448837 [Aspergillus steynii IBT 23096]|uniref:Aminoglycoside phosphotransferase domain-containing protein n=1 Tax=Aspergillus steynii IBT 23096 TaxID=1392250 RepID=A0A2I2G2R3_9EURO|nr:uncharacterized protein P170DRAFT_448837 [Aspergillus steynii IBT 23096]PLB47162.1 hypothetical protein P170DRAFT_448837 [Aspergillus steynii IBT 23096]
MARLSGQICSWVTGFHPDSHPSRLDGGFMNGSYNVCQKFVFDDGTIWILRLPRARSVAPEYADEKVAMEVEALRLIREKTSIPVPEVYAWGLARENTLGLGPFILMSFINGICLNDLFNIDFDHIGSLPMPTTNFPAPKRPLTWKMHEILRVGGVSTSEYFQCVNNQDWQQLRFQPNSIAGPRSARILNPRIINHTYENGPFKLICDDFGLGNVIVRSKDDLTITGVVDMEWVYAGPAQLFGSAPWWLLLDRPVTEEWDFEEEEAPKATDRYFTCLEIFIRVLEEEEEKTAESDRKELTELVKWSKDSGAMWLHMLLSSGFFDTPTFPYMQLRNHKGAEWWDERMQEHRDAEDAEKFVADKLDDLAAYDKINDRVEHLKVLMDNKEISTDDFICTVSSLLNSDR